MLDIKSSADYLSRSAGSFSNFSMLFAGKLFFFFSNCFDQKVKILRLPNSTVYIISVECFNFK